MEFINSVYNFLFGVNCNDLKTIVVVGDHQKTVDLKYYGLGRLVKEDVTINDQNTVDHDYNRLNRLTNHDDTIKEIKNFPAWFSRVKFVSKDNSFYPSVHIEEV